MREVLLGASGKAGGPILQELLDRGHHVTAVVRDPARLPTEGPSLHHRVGDVFDTDFLADAVRHRTADDELLVNAEGASRISAADLAVAVVDEVENPKHPRRRLAVGW